MKRYELRVKTGDVHISHCLHKCVTYSHIKNGCYKEIACFDNRDTIEKRFDKENESRHASITNNGILHVVAYAVLDHETKTIIMQTCIDFKDIDSE